MTKPLTAEQKAANKAKRAATKGAVAKPTTKGTAKKPAPVATGPKIITLKGGIKGTGTVGVTVASLLKLPTNVGVFGAIRSMLATPNKKNKAGWSVEEIAASVAASFERPLSGVRTTVRCQLARKFDETAEIMKERVDGTMRYRIEDEDGEE